MRQQSGSIICPKCGKLISVQEERCPFCGTWRPGLYGWTPVINRTLGNRLDLVNIIIVGCVVLYVLSLALQPGAILEMRGPFGILSPGTRALYQLGMTGAVAWSSGWWWTLFTAIYLHGSLLHIFFNILWIRDLAPAASQAYGRARAFVIFNVAGAIGFLVSNLVTNHPSVGASGAVFGLLAALIVYGRKHGGVHFTQQLWMWAAIMFVMGFVMSGVNNWAHGGGFAGGWVAAEFAGMSERREGRLIQVLALALIAIVGVGIVLSFVNVTSILMR
jgi:rhomboid protease GluP